MLQADSSNALYSQGHFLFMLGPTLMAQPFDLERLTLSGGPVPIADRVESQSVVSVPNGLFSVSERISPNGRWVAYRSTESGREEIFVVPYPGPGDRVQVSSSGGKFPRWRRDGKERGARKSSSRKA